MLVTIFVTMIVSFMATQDGQRGALITVLVAVSMIGGCSVGLMAPWKEPVVQTEVTTDVEDNGDTDTTLTVWEEGGQDVPDH
ncbi:MAG: hypothetical protein ABIE94_00340 [archaeon]